MITIMPESNETILVVKASGLLTHDDYEMIFIPELKACIKVGAFFISGETKMFHVDQFHQAFKWVAE